MNKIIKWKRVFIGILLFAIGLIPMNGYNFIFIITGILFLVFCKATNYYCADCGQYLGSGNDGRHPCHRCGCNVCTTYYNGVGRTTRNR